MKPAHMSTKRPPALTNFPMLDTLPMLNALLMPNATFPFLLLLLFRKAHAFQTPQLQFQETPDENPNALFIEAFS